MKTRVDVGANVGDFCIPWLKDPDVEVFAFEPDPYAFAQLKKKTNNHPRFFSIPKAISSVEGTFDFYISLDPSSSSLLPYTEEGLEKWVCPPGRSHGIKETIKVETIRLDNFFYQNGIKEIDYLKIDSQGHDLEVVKSAGYYLKKIRIVLMEVQTTEFELYKDCSKMEDVLKYMDDHGFNLMDKENNTGEQEVNLLFRNRS